MKFKFTKVKGSSIPNHTFLLRPLIDVNFINGTRNVFTKALIDTGADGIILNIGFAKLLNINAKDGIQGATKGIENKPVPVYYHNIEMEIPNFSNSRFSVQVGFIDSGSVGVLLGRIDFLDRFKLTFEQYNNSFEIELYPKPSET